VLVTGAFSGGAALATATGASFEPIAPLGKCRTWPGRIVCALRRPFACTMALTLTP
jgi:hypothetical protein